MRRDFAGVRFSFAPIHRGEGSCAILFVHGFGSRPAAFRRYVDFFALRNFHSEAIRLPGFGEPLENARTVTARDWVDAVTDAARRLRATHATVWIAGHSLGAAIALRAVREQPGLADGLVLMAPLIAVSRARSLGISPFHLFYWASCLTIFSRAVESIFPIDVCDPAARAEEERDRFIPLNLYAALFEVLDGIREFSLDPKCPVLMLLASEDKVIDSEAARRWIGRQRCPRRVFQMPSRTGHLLMLDTQWESGAREMAAFIQQLSNSVTTGSIAEQGEAL